jgi:hypothetical protein
MTKELLNPEGAIGARDVVDGEERSHRPRSAASRRRATEAGGHAAPERVPDPELAERPKRRRFGAEYKLAILREADAATRQGETGREIVLPLRLAPVVAVSLIPSRFRKEAKRFSRVSLVVPEPRGT